ncbi:unnamed protein product [Didymodactylos carnosus]|uniref:TIR domain-containing protein n=1 Tax=Didymodactylos carnosus TaxID=1234261 RepID=A0A814Z8S7_9BILA|nr:unnamed protein product [Didymodactylos carnosus]CAF4002672.1 unnamed protein product [Didymodactylos carnosus]
MSKKSIQVPYKDVTTNFSQNMKQIGSIIHQNNHNNQFITQTEMSKALTRTHYTASPSQPVCVTTPSFLKPKIHDIMISYSHDDNDLCFKVYKRLLEHGFRIWIDKENMHGQQMNAMADAIESTHFVLLCMSESYMKSEYCEHEAKYAKQCKCTLIPLIMTKGFHPTGWLGFLTVDRKYINFTKYEFDEAISMLLDEIEMYRSVREQNWFKAQ